MASQIFINFSAEKNVQEAWELELVNYLKTTLLKIADVPILVNTNYDTLNNASQIKKQANIILLVFNGFFSEEFSKDLKDLENNHKPMAGMGTELLVIVKNSKFISLVPSFLTDCNQYHFFENNIRTNEIIEYTPVLTGDRENMYWSKLTDLAYDLKLMMRSDSSDQLIQDNQTIFLAEVSKDQFKNREILRREFMLLGYQVLPQRPLPPGFKEYKETSLELIKRADFSVHIMGELYGETPVGADYSYPELQNKIISEAYKKYPIELNDNFYRFVWMPPNLEPYDEKQTQYLKRLKRELSDGKSGELIQCSIEEFKELIPVIIKSGKEKATGIVNPVNQVLLITDHPSLLSREMELLISKSGFKCELIDLEQAGDLYPVTDFRKKVQLSKTTLILNSQSDSNWLEGILGITLRNMDHAKQFNELSIALIAEPRSYENLDMEALHVDFFDKGDDKLNQNIEKYLNQIIEHG